MDPLTIPPRSHNTTYDSSVPTHTTSSEPTQSSEQKNESFIVEVFKFAVLALIIVVPFRIFIAQPFIVSGSSMSPTFETGEYLIIDQLSYRFESPQRGDVIVFRFPNDPSKFFIKRIIGLPGEVVELANGYTTISDPATGEKIKLDEPYLVTDRTDDHLTTTLSSDDYFVMGDNRSASSDSRMWGPVPQEDLVGRVLIRLLPLQLLDIFPGRHQYFPNQLSATEPSK